MIRAISSSLLLAVALAGGKRQYGHAKKGFVHKKGPVAVKPAIKTGYVHYKPRQMIVNAKKEVMCEPALEKEITRGEPTICCPEGFELNGRECMAQHFEEPELMCRIGELAGDQCLLKSAPLAKCPEGFFMAAGKCRQTIQEEATCYCPEGFFEEEGRCIAHEPVALVPFCEAGALREALCHFVEKHLFEERCYCPEGFTEENGQCVAYEVYDCTGEQIHVAPKYGGLRNLGHGYKVNKKAGKSFISLPCQEGEDCLEKVSLIQQTCEKKTTCDLIKERFCPAGTVEEMGRCVLKHHLPALMRCPALGDADNCYRVKAAPFVWECPAGYNMAGKRCLASVSAPLEYYCRDGSMMVDDECICNRDAMPFCREGKLVDDMCCIVETAPPTVSYVTTCIGAGCVPEPVEAELDLCNASPDVPACVLQVEQKFGCSYDEGVRKCM